MSRPPHLPPAAGPQVYENADDDQSFFDYDNDNLTAGESRVASYMHDIGEVEYNGTWARVWWVRPQGDGRMAGRKQGGEV